MLLYVFSFTSSPQWENKKSEFKLPPSTTIGSLRAFYAKHSGLEDIASSVVLMHASVNLPDDTIVSSIPLRGEYDFIEASLELGK